LISAEARDIDIKRFENQKGTPQVLLDIMNGVPIKLPDGLWGFRQPRHEVRQT